MELAAAAAQPARYSGAANVGWVDGIVPLTTTIPCVSTTWRPTGLGRRGARGTWHLPLDDAPAAYEMFQKKTNGCVKVVLHP